MSVASKPSIPVSLLFISQLFTFINYSAKNEVYDTQLIGLFGSE